MLLVVCLSRSEAGKLPSPLFYSLPIYTIQIPTRPLPPNSSPLPLQKNRPAIANRNTTSALRRLSLVHQPDLHHFLSAPATVPLSLSGKDSGIFSRPPSGRATQSYTYTYQLLKQRVIN